MTTKCEILNVFGETYFQEELEMYLLVLSINGRKLTVLNPDLVFDWCVNVGMGTWWNLLSEVMLYSEVKQ